jgi:DNA-binding NarL/FixJ family response regulator
LTCNLLLVDDHSLIRAGVRALVLDIPGYAVIGEANDGSQLLEMVEQSESPDIVLAGYLHESRPAAWKPCSDSSECVRRARC